MPHIKYQQHEAISLSKKNLTQFLPTQYRRWHLPKIDIRVDTFFGQWVPIFSSYLMMMMIPHSS